MNAEQMIRAVRAAWENRVKIKTQVDPISDQEQILFRGIDPESQLRILIWQEKDSGVVRSAYPERD